MIATAREFRAVVAVGERLPEIGNEIPESRTGGRRVRTAAMLAGVIGNRRDVRPSVPIGNPAMSIDTVVALAHVQPSRGVPEGKHQAQ